MVRWPLYGGQNEWGKALSGLTKVAFIERWSYYRVATIRRFHCRHYYNSIFTAFLGTQELIVLIVNVYVLSNLVKNANHASAPVHILDGAESPTIFIYLTALLLGELANATRSKSSLKFGVYFSLFEWFHPLFLADKANHYHTQRYVSVISLLHGLCNAP